MEYSIKRINKEERNLPESYMHPQVLDLFKVERKLLESGYSKREIDLIIDDLRSIEDIDKEKEIMTWVKSGNVTNPEIRQKMDKFGISFPAAFLESKNKVTRHG